MSVRSENTRGLGKEFMCLMTKDKLKLVSMVYYFGNEFRNPIVRMCQNVPSKQKTNCWVLHLHGVQGVAYSIPGKTTPQTAITEEVWSKKAVHRVPTATEASLSLRPSDLASPGDIRGEWVGKTETEHSFWQTCCGGIKMQALGALCWLAFVDNDMPFENS